MQHQDGIRPPTNNRGFTLVELLVVLLIIGLFRGLVILTGEVWIAYLICGGILILVGAFLWTLRFSKPPDEADGKA